MQRKVRIFFFLIKNTPILNSHLRAGQSFWEGVFYYTLFLRNGVHQSSSNKLSCSFWQLFQRHRIKSKCSQILSKIFFQNNIQNKQFYVLTHTFIYLYILVQFIENEGKFNLIYFLHYPIFHSIFYFPSSNWISKDILIKSFWKSQRKKPKNKNDTPISMKIKRVN